MHDVNMNNKMGLLYNDDPKYKCLCGVCDVVTGVKVFLTLFIIGNCLQLFQTTQSAVASFLFVVMLIIVISCTISAIVNEDPTLLWAFIIITVVEMIVAVAAFICLFGVFYYEWDWGREWMEDYLKEFTEDDLSFNDIKKVCIGLMVGLLVLLAYEMWVLRVLVACKSYFKEQRRIRKEYEQNDARDSMSTPNGRPYPSNLDPPPPYQQTPGY